ncbi:DUF397 domain-containing protein [Streptomyces sp. NPDC020875]|uniref:DUF397 domain-containing protein n=1 Tax=Streptomyces sp. NPDC020875 TaxID=3154898 RepID=UPI0033F84FB1
MTTDPLNWIKSSYSGSGGSCVEWAPDHIAITGLVPVRDSKNPTGPSLAVREQAFSAFVTGVKTGDFKAI